MHRLAAVCFAVLLPVAAWAQTWTAIGPPGGDVRSLSIDPRDPSRLFLGTADGVLYASGDGGRTWTRRFPGFPQRGMSLDEVIVTVTGDLLVGYWEVDGPGGGVALSKDGGQTFRALPGVEGQSVRALAQAPSDPRVLVAGALGGVFRSEDGGASWRRITPAGHLELRNVESVAIDPQDPRVLYIGTWHLPWKTSDAGERWSAIHTGMIDDSDVFTITLDRRSPRTVYATACSGIYRSADAAALWAKVRGIPASSRRTRAFAQDAERPDTFYAGTTEGLWVSDDGTSSWRLVTRKDLVVNSIAVLPGGQLLLGTDGSGVLRSADRGLSWTGSNTGFSARQVSQVEYDAASGRLLAAIHADRQSGGVLAASLAGGAWERLAPGLEGREVLALSASEPLLAGTDEGAFALLGGAWRPLPATESGRDLRPRVLAVARAGTTLLLATPQGLLRGSVASGGLSRVPLGPTREVVAVAASGELALAATAIGVFESRDAGQTWTQVSAGLAGVDLRSLALVPWEPRTALASSSGGLLRSADGGRTWSGIPALLHADITSLVFDGAQRRALAADFGSGGLYESRDAGRNWRALSLEGLISPRIWSVAPLPGSRLVAAVPGHGLHIFTPPAASHEGE
jgi:photosystem II stability/assembly factor-like uncharacterized protein